MQDITAILVHYTDQSALDKALVSLDQLATRLKSILVFQEHGTMLFNRYGEDDRIQFIMITHQDLGVTLNDMVNRLMTPYLLFLQHTDYLLPSLKDNALHLPRTKQVLGTRIYYHDNIIVPRALLIHKELLQKEPFFSSHHLPFKEAILPAWLSKVDEQVVIWREGLVKQVRKNKSANTIEKQKMMHKYRQTKNTANSPTISVMMSNYNMEKYVGTAVASCLLQIEQPEEVLVIDDGSTDHSNKLLERWNKEERVKVFHKTNGGKARALNELLPHLKTDFVLELDGDDWLDPDAIKVIKQYLSELTEDISVLYGNLRRWKQMGEDADVHFKTVSHGVPVDGWEQLKNYHFPLGPRIYRTSLLKKYGGFPVIAFADGRLYEDVSVLGRLIRHSRFCYRDFTVYNIREHSYSITKQHHTKWQDFIRTWSTGEDRGDK